MNGWAGCILHVDLATGKIEKRPYDEKLGREFLGGRGVNSRILYNEIKPGCDALSPDNPLIIGTGPLAGTICPTPNKTNVTAKSPLYNGMGQSNAGGAWAPELKYAGYDHLVFRNKSPEPVFLWIDDDRVELRSAKPYWGLDAFQADDKIREDLGDPDIKVAAVGIGAERLVRFSTIAFTQHRSAATTGMGTVMGSKNLKAVAVRGTKTIRVADPARMKKLAYESNQRIYKGMTYPVFSLHGSPLFFEIDNSLGLLAVKNYQQSGEWEGIANYTADKIFEHYIGDKACHGCPVHCSHYYKVKSGPYKDTIGCGIEVGHLYSFASLLDNRHLTSIFKLVDFNNRLGLDMFECGGVIAAAMEWYEKGIITKKDTDGMELKWGDHEVIIELVRKIAYREGFGNVLAEGGVRASKMLGKGAEECLSHCKGVLAGADDVRPMVGTALTHSTGTIPCHHEEGATMMQDRNFPSPTVDMKKEFDIDEYVPAVYDKKERPAIYYQDVCEIMDSVEQCKFVSSWAGQDLGFETAAGMFSAATGIEMTPDDMKLIGDKLHTLERAFAVREGTTRKDDHLHGKLVNEPTQNGPYKGSRLDPEKFELLLDAYYTQRGWDKATGIPTRAKLERVGLKDVADDLEKMGKLPPA